MFWLGLTVMICYVPGYTGAYISTQWPVLAVVLWLGLLRKGPFTGSHWLFVAFIAYATVHAFFTPMPHASVYGLWLVWIMGLCMWFGTTTDDLRPLYAGMAIGAAVSSLFAITQFFGVNFPERVTVEPAGLLANRIQLGTLLALIVIALVTERMWLWALPLVPGILLSGSRGSLVALAVGLLGCRIRTTWLFLVFAAGLALYFYFAPLSASDRERVYIWKTFTEHLTVFGMGPGTAFGILIPKLESFPQTMHYPEHAHNELLNFAFEYGIGCIPLLFVFILSLRDTAFRGWPVVLGFATAACYSMPLYMPGAAFLTLVVMGHGFRRHALDGERGYRGRQPVIPWRRVRRAFGHGLVPFSQGNPAKG